MEKSTIIIEKSLCESELKVLEHLWSEGATAAKVLTAKLEASTNWRKTTSYTVIKNCIEKGLIVRDEPHYVCRPAVTKAEVQKSEIRLLIDKLFDGSNDIFLAFLLQKLLSRELASSSTEPA